MDAKSNRPLLIVIVAAVAMALCICCVLLFGAAYLFLPRSQSNFDLNIGLAATHSEIVPTQRFAVEPAGKLVITNPVGDIDIQVGGGDEIVVEAVKRVNAVRDRNAQSLLERTSIQADSTGAVTAIVVETPKNLRGSSVSVDLNITLPPQTELEIDQGVGNVQVRGTEGRADVGVEVGNITVSSANLSGASDLRVGVGNIHFTGVLEFGDVSMITGVGDVRLWLPADSAFRLDAKTDIGAIEIDFPLTDGGASDEVAGEKIEGQTGPSPALSLKLRSDAGDIEVRSR